MSWFLVVLFLCTLSLVVGEKGEEGEAEGSGGEAGEQRGLGEEQLAKSGGVKESRGTYFYCKFSFKKIYFW